jgi:hypothetical protein
MPTRFSASEKNSLILTHAPTLHTHPSLNQLHAYLASVTPGAATPPHRLAAFVAGAAALGLTRAEALAAANLAPARDVEAYLLLPDLDARLGDVGGAGALLDLVRTHLVVGGQQQEQQEQQQEEAPGALEEEPTDEPGTA